MPRSAWGRARLFASVAGRENARPLWGGLVFILLGLFLTPALFDAEGVIGARAYRLAAARVRNISAHTGAGEGELRAYLIETQALLMEACNSLGARRGELTGLYEDATDGLMREARGRDGRFSPGGQARARRHR